MGTRVFAERSGAKLISDERDIAVDWRIRIPVWEWLVDNNIECEYQGANSTFGVDLWRIKNPEHRTLFLLKWGNADCS